jgi:hypothetical protein
MERYRQANIRTSEDDKDFYETQLLPDVERSPEDTIITTESGQRLDRLPCSLYGDTKHWSAIAAANNTGS